MEKNWNAMEKLWKSYGIFFLGICTNPDLCFFNGDRFEVINTTLGMYTSYIGHVSCCV